MSSTNTDQPAPPTVANIEIPHTGNRTVDWAVHSAAINIIMKILIGLTALMIPAFAWGVVQMWLANSERITDLHEAALRNTAAAVARNTRIDEKLDKINSNVIDLKILQNTLETLQKTVSIGFDAQGKRIDKNDRDIEELRREMHDTQRPGLPH